jgi:hypothetical protein
MSDSSWRELERRWRAEPTNQSLLSHLIEARRREGAPVPFDLIVARERWRPLADFVARWHDRPLEEKDGVSEETLDPELPLAIREYYRIAGQRPELTGSTSRVPASELHVSDGHLWLFAYEGHARWGVRRDELDEDDPPVTLEVTARQLFSLENERASEFFFQNAVRQPVMSGRRHGTTGWTRLTIDEVLAPRFRSLSPRLHWPPAGARLFGDDDLLIEALEDPQSPRGFFFAVARDAEAMTRLHRLLPSELVEWPGLSDDVVYP